jgi:hypothetical protein
MISIGFSYDLLVAARKMGPCIDRYDPFLARLSGKFHKKRVAKDGPFLAKGSA